MRSKGGLIYHLTYLLYILYLIFRNFKTPKITSSAVEERLFEVLVLYLSVTFVSHTRSQQKKRMLSICMHACSQLLSPVVDGRVNNAVLQTVPYVN